MFVGNLISATRRYPLEVPIYIGKSGEDDGNSGPSDAYYH